MSQEEASMKGAGRCTYCGKEFTNPEDAKPVNHKCKLYVFTPGDSAGDLA